MGDLNLTPDAPVLAPLFSGAAVLIVLGQGIGQAETIVCHPIIIGHLFGRKYYAKVYGFVLAFSSLVGAATPLIYGALYSRSGSYAPTYLLFALIYWMHNKELPSRRKQFV